jgi:translation initiation factor 3 subunit E
MSSQYDLTSKFGTFLDVHQLLKILDFYEDQGVYPKEEILKGKVDLLSKTNMIAYAIDVYQKLHGDVPAEMENQKATLIKTLEELKKRSFLGLFDPERQEELHKIGDNWNTAYLAEHYKMTKEDVDALYKLSKFYFECGQYDVASEQLKYFRLLNTDPAKDMSALWGKLCADIVIASWNEASKDLVQLKEAIETSVSSPSPMKQLQQRCWYIHWSLFVHFPRQGGLSVLLDQFLGNERYLNAIQSATPWVFRYLVVASIISKTKQKELIKILDQETYTDPIVAFFKALYGKYNFEEAEKQLALCEPVLTNDYFINGSAEVKQIKTEFLSAGKFAICEAFCTIHSTIDISMMANKLGMNNEEAECWIVNFIRSAKLEAKIDTANNLVKVHPRIPSVYQQSLEKTKILMLRTGVHSAQAAQAEKASAK